MVYRLPCRHVQYARAKGRNGWFVPRTVEFEFFEHDDGTPLVTLIIYWISGVFSKSTGTKAIVIGTCLAMAAIVFGVADEIRRQPVFAAIAGYTHFGLPPIAGAPVGALVAVLIAALIGVPTLRLSGHYFSMATIAVAELIAERDRLRDQLAPRAPGNRFHPARQRAEAARPRCGVRAGGGVTRISNNPGRYATPVWSPRGDYIAFTKLDGGQFYIGIMQEDGRGERILAQGFLAEGPTWAPNGRVLMFFKQERGAGVSLYSIDVTGRGERRVETGTEASDPAWSPLLKD